MKNILFAFIAMATLTSCNSQRTSSAGGSASIANEKPSIDVISHATFIMNWNGTTIYIDPVGGADSFAGKPAADLVLVTDVHGDHADAPTLKAVQGTATLVTPQAVATKIGADFAPTILANGETKTIAGFTITAVPMYNLTSDRLKFHEKGRGNGYIIEKDGYRVYISGDTEDIPEMRALKNIDLAFVCMNLPYTMVVEQATSAVLEFKPKEVIPYHYRGSEGKLDTNKFKSLVNAADKNIEVRLLNWYPES